MKLFKKTTIGVSAIVLLASMNFLLMNKLNHFENRFNIVINEMNNLSHQMSNLQSEFYRLNQDKGLVSSHSFNIENRNNFESANVKVNITLNEYKPGSRVLIMYKDRDIASDGWQVKELEKHEGLNFLTELDLSYDKNYSTQLLIEGNKEQLSEELTTINLKDELYQRVNMRIMPRQASSNGSLTYEVEVRNNFHQSDLLKLKSIVGYIFYNDKLVHQVDIMKSGEKRNWSTEHQIEEWSFTESIRIEEMKQNENDQFMKELVFKLIAKDMLDKEYEYRYGERGPIGH